jgi:hypothetical protein
MNHREFSDIEIFQHSEKGIPLFKTDNKNCLQADYDSGMLIFAATTTYTKQIFIVLEYHSRSGKLSVPEKHRRRLLLQRASFG